MGHDKESHYADKHPKGTVPDPQIAAELNRVQRAGHVRCADAHQIATTLSCSPAEVGKTMDLLDFRIVKCQLGLFGYQPAKRIAKPADSVAAEMERDIRSRLENGRLSCWNAWSLAEAWGTPRLKVAEVCEALKIKVVQCQLGAF